jgi:ATP-dependent exoDNAse (exonuclease V) alpha subunit
LHDGTSAGIGDRIITRRVDRHIPDGTEPAVRPDERGRYSSGFVKNGTSFTITDVRRDGALVARATGSARETTLPTDYVARHVELGYAVTAHRCQGMTVGTTHTIATSRMTCEAFYVALTRGTRSNRAYIATDIPSEHDTAFGAVRTSRDEVLDAILSRSGTEPAAHTLRDRFQKRDLGTPQRLVALPQRGHHDGTKMGLLVSQCE